MNGDDSLYVEPGCVVYLVQVAVPADLLATFYNATEQLVYSHCIVGMEDAAFYIEE